MDARNAGLLLSIANLVGIPIVLLIPVLAVKLRNQTPVVLGMAALYTIALAGLTLDPEPLALVWMIVLGLAQSATLSLAVTFMLLRSPDPAHAAQLSSMSQCAGYMLAAVGPFLFGALRDFSSSWIVPMIALFICVVVPITLVGIGAARPRFVGARTLPA
jgi:CP family cyanate transporter-like MFS transporter